MRVLGLVRYIAAKVEMTIFYIVLLLNLMSFLQSTKAYTHQNLSNATAPAAPYGLKVINTSSSSVQLSWKAPLQNSSDIIRYIVQYMEHDMRWIERMVQVGYSGELTERQLSMLKSSTLYKVRVVAEYKTGESDPSNVVTFATAEEAPVHHPSAVRAEAANEHRLNVYWKPPVSRSHEDITGFYVGYKITSEDVPYTFETINSVNEPFQSYHLVLNNLKHDTEYSIVVQAFNKIGVGPISSAVIARTRGDHSNEEPPPTDDVVCTTLSSESINVSWSPPILRCINSAIDGYEVIFGPSELYENTKYVRTTTSSNMTLDRLSKNTNYIIQVVANTAKKNGKLSNRVHCQTEEDVPEAPEVVKVLITSSSSILVIWKPPGEPNGVVEQYTVYMRKSNFTESEDADADTVDKIHKIVVSINNSLSFEAKYLDSRFEYEFWVTASTNLGEGQPSASVFAAPSIQVPVSILSLDDTITVTYQENVTLPCAVIGALPSQITWKKKSRPVILKDPNHQQRDGSLFLHNVTRNDAGEYSCHVEDSFGQDSTTYQLCVKSPPSAPQVTSLEATADSLKIGFKPHPDDTEPVTKYKILYRAESQRPVRFAWQRIQLENQFWIRKYNLKNLFCNTTYVVQVIAYNSLGKGDPSEELIVSTLGVKPVQPSASNFISTGSTRAILDFAAWSKGGCQSLWRYMYLKQQTNTTWTRIKEDVDPNTNFFIWDLEPNTAYNLRVIATNAVGTTVAEYDFTTLLADEDLEWY